MSFEMHIIDVFKFVDGRTAFIGPITGSEQFVTRCDCELLIDGTVSHVVEIEGEMIPDTERGQGFRALSTLQAVPFDRDRLVASHSILRKVN